MQKSELDARYGIYCAVFMRLVAFRKYKPDDYPVFYDMLSNLENMKYRSSEPKSEEDVHFRCQIVNSRW